MCRLAFITNNTVYSGSHSKGLEHIVLEGTAFDVIRMARDKVHLGWRMLHHPLYGNIRPRLQPFRSILLQAPCMGESTPDLFSLHLIDSAISVYQSEAEFVPLPHTVPQVLRDDCAFLDGELMCETLRQAGLEDMWPPANHGVQKK